MMQVHNKFFGKNTFLTIGEIFPAVTNIINRITVKDMGYGRSFFSQLSAPGRTAGVFISYGTSIDAAQSPLRAIGCATAITRSTIFHSARFLVLSAREWHALGSFSSFGFLAL